MNESEKQLRVVHPVELLSTANTAYREGNPILSDNDFDSLEAELKEIDPGNGWFKKGIQDPQPVSRKEKLPIPMYSLEKIKTYEEFEKWVKSTGLRSIDDLVITPKYDGISLCVNEKNHHALTRGDGEFGQCCDHHFPYLIGFSNIYELADDYYSFGEVIFSRENFLKVKESSNYKSARNAAAGIINSDEVTPYSSLLSYVRYGSNKEDENKRKQLEALNEINETTKVDFVTLQVASLLQGEESFKKTMQILFDKLTKEYRCDGLVIDIDDYSKRQELGRLPNNNPRYAIAYKDPDWSEREDTIVKEVKWQISKDGKLSPVINVSPVDLCGATISKCTAYNARYVEENNIAEGATITICRSGDVIPKHLKTISRSNTLKILPEVCPICGKPIIWDGNRVDLICSNKDCEGILLARCVYFFSVLDFKEFREPTIRKIFEAGYHYPWQIINLIQEDLQKIEGLGNVAAKVLSSQFIELKKKGTNFAKLLTALNLFNGAIAEKNCQKILDGMKLYSLRDVEDFVNKITKDTVFEIEETIEGVGSIIAEVFLDGLMTWSTFGGIIPLPITYYGLEEKTFEGQMTVVFTGFRNKEWEQQLTSNGHKISNSVSKKTTCVVVKEKGSGTTKEEKAISLGVPIFTMQEFKEKFL